MSRLDDLVDAIALALDECSTAEVLGALTGATIAVVELAARASGNDPDLEIRIEGDHRDITIHAKKGE